MITVIKMNATIRGALEQCHLSIKLHKFDYMKKYLHSMKVGRAGYRDFVRTRRKERSDPYRGAAGDPMKGDDSRRKLTWDKKLAKIVDQYLFRAAKRVQYAIRPCPCPELGLLKVQ